MAKLRTRFLDYDSRPRPKTQHYCCKCQRDLAPGAAHRMVHLIDGGLMVLHPADESLYLADAGDVGLHPIGMDCARQLGMEWTHQPAVPG